VLLAEVDENLDAYTKDVDKIRKQAIAELRKEMKALSADLDNKANSNSLAKTCEGCWNRISELVG
jgi:F0F1-type ATP synthase membrane subunit b/b'